MVIQGPVYSWSVQRDILVGPILEGFHEIRVQGGEISRNFISLEISRQVAPGPMYDRSRTSTSVHTASHKAVVIRRADH